MAEQSYGTAPGRNSGNAVGTSPSRAKATKPVPLILSHMNASAKAVAPKTVKKRK